MMVDFSPTFIYGGPAFPTPVCAVQIVIYVEFHAFYAENSKQKKLSLILR